MRRPLATRKTPPSKPPISSSSWPGSGTRNSDARSRTLRSTTFSQLDGAEGIVRTHFAATLGKLNDLERSVAHDVLRYLVTPGGSKIAQEPGSLAALDRTPARPGRGCARPSWPPTRDRILRRLESPDTRPRACLRDLPRCPCQGRPRPRRGIATTAKRSRKARDREAPQGAGRSESAPARGEPVASPPENTSGRGDRHHAHRSSLCFATNCARPTNRHGSPYRHRGRTRPSSTRADVSNQCIY